VVGWVTVVGGGVSISVLVATGGTSGTFTDDILGTTSSAFSPCGTVIAVRCESPD
jgi:hypothetical protein